MLFNYSAKFFMTVLAVSSMGLTSELALSQTQSASNGTTFQCVSSGSGFATVAKRGERTTAPLITWNSSEFGTQYQPEQRCNIVSNRLTEVVSAHGGKLRNLQMTYGRVKGNPVICYVESRNEICNRKNTLITLRQSDRGRERQILEQLVTFSLKGTGNAVQQSAPQFYAPFGEAVEHALGSEAATTLYKQ
jgi:hypothetical protein